MARHAASRGWRRAAVAVLTLALGAYLLYRTGQHAPVHPGPVLGPHWTPLHRPHPLPVPVRPLHTYVVRPGDCLWTIGRAHHVPWRTLAVSDHLHTPYLIYPGQVLHWR